MTLDDVKEQLSLLPGNRFVRAWKAIEDINTLLDATDADALLVITYTKLTREAKVMAEANFVLQKK